MPPVNSAARTQQVQQRSMPNGNAPAVLAALRAVMERPNNAMVQDQTVALARALRESGVQDVSWVPYLMENMKKVASGEDKAAVDWVKGNINTANNFVPGVRSSALAMVNRAEKKGFPNGVQNRVGPQDAFYGPANGRAEAAKFFDGWHKANRRGELVSTLRQNGFSYPASETTAKLFDAYTTMRNSSGYNDTMYKAIDQVKSLAQQAYQAGTIDKRTRDSILGPAGAAYFENKYPREKKDAVLASVAQAKQNIVNSGQQYLNELSVLRDSLAKRNGWSIEGGIPFQNARLALNKMPNLEKAVASGNVDQIKSWMKEIKQHTDGYGGPEALAQKLAENHKWGISMMEKISDGVGMIPGLGNAAKLMFGGSVEFIKYASNEQTLAQAITNTALKAVNVKVGPLLKGTGAGKALLSSLNGSLQSFAKDAAKIMSDGQGNVGERLEAAAKKAIFAGFKAGIESQAKVLAGDAETRKLILAAATKFGIDPQIKPILDEIGRP